MATELLAAQKTAEIIREESPTPLSIMQIAMSQENFDVDKLTKLLELQVIWDANVARKAFNTAMAQFKKNPPKITKNKDVRFGTTSYSHATLDHVTDLITTALSAVGISHKWAVDQSDQIAVTCILTHEMGHSESTTLKAGADSSGSKNGIQAIGSTVTYLQRYTLLAATGLAAGFDDDGVGPAAAKGMDQEEFDRLCGLIEAAETVDSLSAKYLAACADAKEKSDDPAIKKFAELKNKRYRELVPKVGAK